MDPKVVQHVQHVADASWTLGIDFWQDVGAILVPKWNHSGPKIRQQIDINSEGLKPTKHWPARSLLALGGRCW